MPWTGKSFASRHNKSLFGAAATKTAEQANAILRSGAPEGIAIATANKEAARRRGAPGFRGRKSRSYTGS